jgi:hypothetical protein
MASIGQWVEKNYVNNFLLPLADRWSDQVWRLGQWQITGPVAQRNFFEHYVRPFLAKDQKVFVIVSDGLRFEAAAEFAERLQSANRWTAELEPMFGSLPSYTQLGMAALLPCSQLAITAESGNVSVNGKSATGTENRAEILREACNARATAIKAEQFLDLNTKTDRRALMRDHDVIRPEQRVSSLNSTKVAHGLARAGCGTGRGVSCDRSASTEALRASQPPSTTPLSPFHRAVGVHLITT